MIIDFRDYVPLEIYKAFGSKSRIFIDPKIVEIHKVLEDTFKAKVIINNYHLGGQLKERGFRTPKTTTGAALSQHRFGRAIDITITGINALQAYNIILEAPQRLISAGATTIEDIRYTSKGNWIHLDCRDLDINGGSLNIVVP